jgi:hypothetical protein
LSAADALTVTVEFDVARDATKDPIEGDLFEGDISGVRLVAKSDLDLDLDLETEGNLTIKNAIVNTYLVGKSALGQMSEILIPKTSKCPKPVSAIMV